MVRLAERTEVALIVIRRARIVVRGAVQGVGFRPFVYRLATDLGLNGWVRNSSQGVFIEAEAAKEPLDLFILRIQKDKPRLAVIQSLEFSFLDPTGMKGFEIRHSSEEGEAVTLVLPDIAMCEDCLAELLDPGQRRYRYPFTNCTNCGPRYSIVHRLPYDRANTSMREFEMCPLCREEYEDPRDRRFHAQPIACPRCGPRLELWKADGEATAEGDDALGKAADAIRAGQIVAVKDLGGFHLMADARNEEAVARLRARKRREEKPFALMYPGIEQVRQACELSEFEQRCLLSPESPIVLLWRRRAGPSGEPVADDVAPGNPWLGIMLPGNPLQHILMRELNFPVVATSGNLSDEPICIDEHEAVERLRGIADLYLVHNRPIVRHVDDSIVRIMLGREMVLRRARGYAPLPVRMPVSAAPILALGGHLKNSVVLTIGSNAFISQHIGDLETREALDAFRQVADSLIALYGARPELIAADMHPDYLSTRYARAAWRDFVAVQHHHAHVAACVAENEVAGPVLGVAWDGTGYGPDGTVWGGEFLLCEGGTFSRAAHLRTFRLPGGDAAVREPRRSALGALFEILGESLWALEGLAPLSSFSESDRSILRRMLLRGINAPWSSSAGRLFDAVASIAGLRQTIRFEGQAAMMLEFALPENARAHLPYPFRIVEGEAGRDKGPRAGEDTPARIVDWEALLRAVVADATAGVPVADISARFHNALAEMVIEVAKTMVQERVVLTGGCFQNRYLTERTVERLEDEGFRPYWHQRVPPNDGGIALGQALIAAFRKAGG